MSEINELNKSDFPASIVRRGAAFLVDCVISVIPVLAIYLILLHEFPMEPLVLSPVPIVGTITIYDLPLDVDDALNTITNEDGTQYKVDQNVSFSATSIRIISVLSMVFYIFYATFCTYLYGKTIGKKLFGMEVEYFGKQKTIIWCLLRETLGKVILNTTIIIPVLSIITMLVTPKHRTIHDFIGNTMVVETF